MREKLTCCLHVGGRCEGDLLHVQFRALRGEQVGDPQGLGDVIPVGLKIPLELALVSVAIEAVVVLEKRGAGSERDDEPRTGFGFLDRVGRQEPALMSCVRCGPSWSLMMSRFVVEDFVIRRATRCRCRHIASGTRGASCAALRTSWRSGKTTACRAPALSSRGASSGSD